jgi:hypothetical protein
LYTQFLQIPGRKELNVKNGVNQRGERQQLKSYHKRGPKTVPAQTAEITKCHVIFVVFFKF